MTESFFKDVAVGSGAAIPTIVGLMPLINWKGEAQQARKEGRPPRYSLNPKVLYRGTPSFAGSFVPTIALQNVVAEKLGGFMHPVFAAFGAGSISALIVGPFELLLNQQQMTGEKVYQTAMRLYKTGGLQIFARGFVPTAIREGGSAGAIFGLMVWGKKKLEEQGFSGAAATLISALFSATFATTVTQGADTFKTQLQRDLNFKCTLWKGITQPGAMSGFGFRLPMMQVAVMAIPYFKGVIAQKFKEK